MQAQRIAIVGSGISGLTAAYLLGRKHDITVFEANDYIGGHTHTVTVRPAENSYAIDTGFIVCSAVGNSLLVEHQRLIGPVDFLKDCS